MIYGLNANTAWACFYNAVAGSGGGIWKTTDGGGTWTQQGLGSIFDANSFPNVVHFWDDSVGFAMGDPNPGTQYEIYTTTDGGTTWTRTPALNIPASIAGEFGSFMSAADNIGSFHGETTEHDIGGVDDMPLTRGVTRLRGEGTHESFLALIG